MSNVRITPQTTDGKMDRKMKIILVSGIAFAFLTWLVAGISALIPRQAPDPAKLGPSERITYMASKEFARLPEKEKVSYLAKVRRSRSNFRNLTPVERQAVFKNTRKIMHRRMKERMDKFFKMNKEEQNKFLDELIARIERHRAEREARNAQNGNSGRRGGGGGPGGNHAARMQAMLESTDSTSRAQMTEFHKLLQARRAQTQGK
ncbi:MAG: hypothetical protein PHH77_04430 [Victivallaceae bacterium]|nr:hypothetical protein [Victivallaceae bacterium]